MNDSAEEKKDREQVRDLVKRLFKIDGKPLILTDSQVEIFSAIFRRDPKRLLIKSYTQYGKTMTVALAVLLRASTFPEKWVIVAPREKQAKISMNYIITHCFDNLYFRSRLEIGSDSLERLRRERSANRLTFRVNDQGGVGEVSILTADTRNQLRSGEGLMGAGSGNVVVDEASLLTDDIESKIFRMIGGYRDNFYLKIGNPFHRNHFYRDATSGKYKVMDINYKVGIKEGRIQPEHIEEAKQRPNFDVLYENKFPEDQLIDEDNYINMFLRNGVSFTQNDQFVGEIRMGVDVAGMGKNKSSWVIRDNYKAVIVAEEKSSSPKTVAVKTVLLAQMYGVKGYNIYIDNFGSGANVSTELAKAGIFPRPVNVGDKPLAEKEKKEFLNMKALAYWRLNMWLKTAQLKEDKRWEELFSIKYKINEYKQMKMMPKDEQIKKGVHSQDFSEALMLTFFDTTDIPYNNEDQEQRLTATRVETKEFDRHAVI